MNQRFISSIKSFFQPKSIVTFKELLSCLDYYRSVGDLPEAGNTAVLISNSLQFAQAPDLSLYYLHLADSMYARSGQDSRRLNVRLNEPTILCYSGHLEEGRDKMDSLLRDCSALRDPLGREIMLRNHYFYFKDSISLFEGYNIIRSLSEDPDMDALFSEIRPLYEALLCQYYMDTNRPDSATYYFVLSHKANVKDWDFQKEIYRIWARYLESHGRYEEALKDLKRYIGATDSISESNDPEKKEYLERLNVIRQHKEEAEREKRNIERKHYFIGALLVFLLLLAIIAAQWIRHRNKLKTIGLQLEAEKMERQILAMSLSKEESDKVLDKVKEETARLKQEGTVSAKDLSEIETNIKLHMAAKDEMQAFEKAFAEVSPDFAERLKELSPSISANNIRLCTYLYMGLSGQQVCGILNITPGALRQAKRRLRQRFGLAGDDSIEDFLRSLAK